MPNRERYRLLLEHIYRAHAEHRKIWEETKRKTGNNTEAYKTAQKASRELFRNLEVLYETTLTPLRQAFLEGQSQAIGEIITFLGVDIPAFRVGYDKEWYYRKLKKLKLSPEQLEELQQIALARCASKEYRREDSELRRLMILVADQKFLDQVIAIPSEKGSRVERHKSRMLQVILEGRKDLR